jgi:hypothetical protein
MVYAARFVGRGLALVVTELRRIADALERGKKDGDS